MDEAVAAISEIEAAYPSLKVLRIHSLAKVTFTNLTAALIDTSRVLSQFWKQLTVELLTCGDYIASSCRIVWNEKSGLMEARNLEYREKTAILHKLSKHQQYMDY